MNLLELPTYIATREELNYFDLVEEFGEGEARKIKLLEKDKLYDLMRYVIKKAILRKAQEK